MKSPNELIKPILAIFITVFSFAYFFFASFYAKGDPQIIIAIVASLSWVGNYYFGASSGSAKKDEAIQNMIDKK